MTALCEYGEFPHTHYSIILYGRKESDRFIKLLDQFVISHQPEKGHPCIVDVRRIFEFAGLQKALRLDLPTVIVIYSDWKEARLSLIPDRRIWPIYEFMIS